jgi:SNF5 / SMARCB1 / INI1
MHQARFADSTDDLVPVRVELNVRGTPVTEYFSWDLTETGLSPTDFATLLVADLQLPHRCIAEISTSVSNQLAVHVSSKQARAVAVSTAESRQVLRLNIRLGRVVLRDQFEWDLADPNNCPESFAESLCADIGLGREFVPAVACRVREQLLELADTEKQLASCRALDPLSVIRSLDATSAWEPVVERLTVTQQENLELKERREARLARRHRSRLPGPEKAGALITKTSGSSLSRLHRRRSSSDVS